MTVTVGEERCPGQCAPTSQQVMLHRNFSLKFSQTSATNGNFWPGSVVFAPCLERTEYIPARVSGDQACARGNLEDDVKKV